MVCMNKTYFLASSLFKNKLKGKKCVVLDNYIAMNNPELSHGEGELHPCPRNSKDDWIRYEKELVNKHNKYFTILSEKLNNIHNVKHNDRYWQQVFYFGLKRYIALVYEFYNQVDNRFDYKNHDFNVVYKSSFYTPSDLEDLRAYLSYSELAYEQLFTIYIEKFHPELASDNRYINIEKYKPSIKNTESFIRKIIFYVYDKFKIFGTKVILLGVQYDSSKTFSLILKSRFKIFLYMLVPFKRHDVNSNEVDINKRKDLSESGGAGDRFDDFFFKTIESFFPQFSSKIINK